MELRKLEQWIIKNLSDFRNCMSEKWWILDEIMGDGFLNFGGVNV